MIQSDAQFDIPIAMIVYKRADLTIRSFAAIRELKPAKLYIIADGPRDASEEKKVREVREYLDTHIDWDCEVHRNYAPQNIGLRYRMPTGMKWVFETEEKAIFIEDDIDATQNFFYFCKEMLEKYEQDERVLMVTGSNIYPEDPSFGKEQILFSQFASIWGWACWKRSFELYDVNMRSWPQVRKSGEMKQRLTPEAYDFYRVLFDDLQYHWHRTWDYQWTYIMLCGKGLGIVPRYNLVKNIGMGNSDGEHRDDTKERIDFVTGVERKEMVLPVVCPDDVVRNEDYDRMVQQRMFPKKNKFFKNLKYGFRASINLISLKWIRKMEKDSYYVNEILPDKYKLTDAEKEYNHGDIYRQVSGREFRRTARTYYLYKTFGIGSIRKKKQS